MDDMMMDARQEDMCKFFQECPICGGVEKIKLMWILAYCKGGKFADCQRYQMREAGTKPEFELLPDGSKMTPEKAAEVKQYIDDCKKAHGVW